MIASLLTISLTASPSFISNKDSGVLHPEFDVSGKSQEAHVQSHGRKVMYYVRKFRNLLILEDLHRDRCMDRLQGAGYRRSRQFCQVRGLNTFCSS